MVPQLLMRSVDIWHCASEQVSDDNGTCRNYSTVKANTPRVLTVVCSGAVRPSKPINKASVTKGVDDFIPQDVTRQSSVAATGSGCRENGRGVCGK